MKPASVTLSYVVYPPNYRPGDGYKSVGRLSNARRACVAYGPGAEVIRTVTKRNRRGGHIYTPHRKTRLGFIEDRWVYATNEAPEKP